MHRLSYFQFHPIVIKNLLLTITIPIRSPSQDATNINRPIELIENGSKQILWGDQHVHTTYSMDAFYISLPLMHGSRGAFPPAFACDYARFISQIDFYVLTDHAESYTPRTWNDQLTASDNAMQFLVRTIPTWLHS